MYQNRIDEYFKIKRVARCSPVLTISSPDGSPVLTIGSPSFYIGSPNLTIDLGKSYFKTRMITPLGKYIPM